MFVKIQFANHKFTPILGWSSSRYDLFSRCKRAYFYNYYSKFVSNISFDKMKYLKSMTSVPMETGSVIHHVVEAFLDRLQKSKSNINQEKMIEFAINKVDKTFDTKVFLEEYYKYTPKIDRSFAKERVKQAVTNFLVSPLFNWITSTPMESRKEWVIEPGGYGETRLNGLKAYCKMDFLLPVDGKVYILDWKSGKKDTTKHGAQLLGYSLATQVANPDILAENIVPKIVYMLPEIEEFEVDINQDMLAEFQQRVKDETNEMQSYCRDIENNTPVDIENFEMCGNENICRHCNFQELCGNCV